MRVVEVELEIDELLLEEPVAAELEVLVDLEELVGVEDVVEDFIVELIVEDPDVLEDRELDADELLLEELNVDDDVVELLEM